MSHAQELVSSLKTLLVRIDALLAAQEEEKDAQVALDNLAYPSHLKAFDEEHLEQFINEKLGRRPVEPSGAMKLLLPVYLIQKGQFDVAHATYEKAVPLAEVAYREAFRDEREELRIRDEVESAEILRAAKARLANATEHLRKAEEELSADKTVSKSLKQRDIIEKLISYLEENRADTLKESVNLYYDEKRKDEEAEKAEAHRKEMIALEEERVRAAQAAEEFQEMAYQEAQAAREAAEAARDAAEQARINSLMDD